MTSRRRGEVHDVPSLLASRNHYVVERWRIGFAITVRRRGRPPNDPR